MAVSVPIYFCVFDGSRCRRFEALRRESGYCNGCGCVVDKTFKPHPNCSHFVLEHVGKRETHRCPFDGDFCKHVRGCLDAWFFGNFLPLPNYCSRAKIRRKLRWY